MRKLDSSRKESLGKLTESQSSTIHNLLVGTCVLPKVRFMEKVSFLLDILRGEKSQGFSF